MNDDHPNDGLNTCPSCGSGRRLCEETVEELKRQGKLSSNWPFGGVFDGVRINVPLLDVAKPMLSLAPKIPVLQILFDVCSDCSTIYCRKVEVVEQDIALTAQPPRPIPPPHLGLS